MLHKNIKNKGKYRRIIAAVVPLIIVMGYVYSYLNVIQYNLGITEFTVADEKVESGIRVALIADLHNHEYGEDNSELLTMIRDGKPDIIAVVGDTVLKKSDDTDVMKKFFSDLAEIAPTYCCLGNHELNLMERGIDIKGIVSETGVTMLDDETVFTEINGNRVAIGGLTYNPDYGTDSLVYLKEFAALDEYKLLLCHFPEYQWQFLKMDIDLVLCGHVHGGLVRVPGVGGLFAPTQGFFPEYTEGVYESDNATMIISRGLGSSSFVPRVNNPTELVFVNIEEVVRN
ncbi:MAG: metallophosphoesterase [Clostridia bacterium]|nr:metallophosphoesterase [Clostridia bacterium]